MHEGPYGAFEHLGAKPWVHLFAGQATPFEARVCSGTFALMPFWLAAFVYLGPTCFDQLDSFAFSILVGGFHPRSAQYQRARKKQIPISNSSGRTWSNAVTE